MYCGSSAGEKTFGKLECQDAIENHVTGDFEQRSTWSQNANVAAKKIGPRFRLRLPLLKVPTNTPVNDDFSFDLNARGCGPSAWVKGSRDEMKQEQDSSRV